MSHSYQNREIQYASNINITHTIIHNLNTITPDITVQRSDTNSYIIPKEVIIVNQNQIRIELSIPRSIKGKIS